MWAKEIQTSGRLTKGKNSGRDQLPHQSGRGIKSIPDDGEVPLDNNATEGSLRSLCLHKHAWKLIDSIDGAQSSAIIYSITETAKANNLNPFRYLNIYPDRDEGASGGYGLSFYGRTASLVLEQLPEICKSKTKTTKCKLTAGNGGHKMSWYSWSTKYGFLPGTGYESLTPPSCPYARVGEKASDNGQILKLSKKEAILGPALHWEQVCVEMTALGVRR